jgi:hypothetical protein
MADYNPDHAGVARMLQSDMIHGAVLMVAEKIKTYAEAIAPVGNDDDPHRGRYKASFNIRSTHRGGARNDRAEAVVYNDAPEAFYVEWGQAGREPYHTMLRAAVEGGRL